MKILDQVTVGSGSIHMYLFFTETYQQIFCPCLCLSYYYYFFNLYVFIQFFFFFFVFFFFFFFFFFFLLLLLLLLLYYYYWFTYLFFCSLTVSIHCIPAAKEILYIFAIKFHLSVTKFIFYQWRIDVVLTEKLKT